MKLVVFGLAAIGLVFSLNAGATSTLKMPVMGADAGDDVSAEATAAVRLEDQQASGTTTAKAGDVGAKAKKFTVGFYSENALVAGQKDWSSFGSTNNINVSYDLGHDRSVQVRQYFLYNLTNQDNPYEWTVGDTAFQYSDSGHKLGSADNLFMARLYVPVNYYSQQVGKYELRLYDFVTQAVNKWIDVTYFVDPRFYSYSVNDAAQTGFQNLAGVQIGYASKTAFAAPYTTFYAQDMWGNGGRGVQLLYAGTAGTYKYEAVNQDYMNVDVGTVLNLSKDVSATLFYEYTTDMRQYGSNTSQPIDNSLSSWNLWFSAAM